MKKLIELLEATPELTMDEIATILAITPEEVAANIEKLRKDGIIRGRKFIINKEKLGDKSVSALIELKVTPKSTLGFDDIAGKIAAFPEVQGVYLMSGGFDIAVNITCETFEEVAMFVAKRLSPLDSIVSTATHFILRRYKELGVKLIDTDKDDRGIVSL